MSDIQKAVRVIRERDPREPVAAMILGSGLGLLADSASEATLIEGSEIPGYPKAGVSGHRGDLVIGELAGRVILFLRGRFHRYEGHDMETLTTPVRIAAALGVERLIVTNASGSLHKSMPAGSLMRITDHINSTTSNPLTAIRRPGHDDPGGPGRPRPTSFDPQWGREADEVALRLGIKLHHGVYVWTLGPSYETPSEIAYFRRIGADAVGMSTVPEVSVAARLGLKVLGFSAITNLAAGLEDGRLSHEDVLEVGRMIRDRMEKLLLAISGAIPDN